ncbi:MAG: ribbon-helix-helix protein, CopG family [Terriglobia bacterium]
MAEQAKRTMTLNLTQAEMSALEELSGQKELSKTALIRQAIRLYQLVDARLARGEKLLFEDEEKKAKAELVLL